MKLELSCSPQSRSPPWLPACPSSSCLLLDVLQAFTLDILNHSAPTHPFSQATNPHCSSPFPPPLHSQSSYSPRPGNFTEEITPKSIPPSRVSETPSEIKSLRFHTLPSKEASRRVSQPPVSSPQLQALFQSHQSKLPEGKPTTSSFPLIHLTFDLGITFYVNLWLLWEAHVSRLIKWIMHNKKQNIWEGK